MGLGKKNENAAVFLAAKHNCLWQEVKRPVEGSVAVEVTNPRTKEVLIKHGFAFEYVEGNVVKVEKYDRRHNGTRYFGFKMTFVDGADTFVLDLPYASQVLRRLLKIAPNVDWSRPLKLNVFKGKKANGQEEMAIWFRQDGASVKSYYTKEDPRGMPQPRQYEDGSWDFRDQHQWLVGKFKNEVIPVIEACGKLFAPPVTPAALAMDQVEESSHDDDEQLPPSAPVTDDDIPF